MVFKARRVGMRLFRVFEDKITVDYNENPLVVDGMRRDALRIARHMEYYFRQVGKE
jgi:ribosomal protein S17E